MSKDSNESLSLFDSPGTRVNPKLLEASVSDSGSDIIYRPLDGEGYSGLGLRIGLKPLVDFEGKSAVKRLGTSTEITCKELLGNNIGRLTSIISSVLSSGIDLTTDKGIKLVTPACYGFCLISESDGSIKHFLFKDAENQEKMSILARFVGEYIEGNLLGNRLRWATVVENVDGLNSMKPLTQLFDTTSNNYSFKNGVDALACSAQLVDALKRRGLVMDDPGSPDAFVYDPVKTQGVVVDIGNFAIYDRSVQLLAKNGVIQIREVLVDLAIKERVKTGDKRDLDIIEREVIDYLKSRPSSVDNALNSPRLFVDAVDIAEGYRKMLGIYELESLPDRIIRWETRNVPNTATLLAKWKPIFDTIIEGKPRVDEEESFYYWKDLVEQLGGLVVISKTFTHMDSICRKFVDITENTLRIVGRDPSGVELGCEDMNSTYSELSASIQIVGKICSRLFVN